MARSLSLFFCIAQSSGIMQEWVVEGRSDEVLQTACHEGVAPQGSSNEDDFKKWLFHKDHSKQVAMSDWCYTPFSDIQSLNGFFS